MQKRNPAILTKKDWKKVELWLKRTPGTKRMTCPWGSYYEQQSEKCAALFPKIVPEPGEYYTCQHSCPCHSYSMKYVTRIAKQLLSQERNKQT